MLLSTVLQSFAASEVAAGERDGEAQTSGAQRRRGSQSLQQAMTFVIIAGAGMLALGSIARAQSPATASGDDPVARAMERIRMTVDARAEAADRALAASKLVKESVEAKKQGKTERAREVLEQAIKMIAENAPAWRSHLIEELLRQVGDERTASDAKSVAAAFPLLPLGHIAKVIPRPTLARYSQYRDTLARILEEEKVPPELLAVALVESGFNPLALSPKGARGIWQFMPATAAAYGLAAGPMNDHRTHPEHSTRAAARYLRDLFQQFGDWKLALAAYNWGETKVQQVIDRTGIRDFDEMARRGLLPLETRKYVPAVLAVWSQMNIVSAGAKAVDLPGRPQAQRRNNIIFARATVRPIGVAAPSAATAKQ
jgi:soluble lytic murein transglycosylase-like protein